MESETLGATRRLVDFVSDTKYEDIPKEAVERAKLMILDSLGCQLAAAALPLGRAVKSYLRDQGGKEQSTVVGLGLKTSCTNAAWANATLAHGLDIDDGDLAGTRSHPTCKTLPSALSVGELVEANGRDVLTAFVLGTETQIRIGMAVNPSHYTSGFHATGTLGTFGAVAAAGKLLGLDRDQMLNAFGIAGSVGAGLKINMGSMVKCYHAGHAAEQGVKAALLAKSGWKATKRILEGRDGFCQVMSKEYGMKKDVVLQTLGEKWFMLDPGVYFKRYPSCGGLETVYSTMISMAKKYDINPDDVAAVEVGTDASQKVSTMTYSQEVDGLPTDSYEAKYSVPAAVAISLIRRKAEIDDITDEIVTDPKTIRLMEKVKHRIDPEVLRFAEPVEKPRQKFKIKMKDRREYFETNAPMDLVNGPEVHTKYRRLSEQILPEDKIKETINLIHELESVDDIRALTTLVAGR